MAGQLAAIAVICIASAAYYFFNPSGLSQQAETQKWGEGAMKGMALASPVTAAGGNLFKQACSMQKAGDVVISPISVVVAMSMAAAGATDGHKSGKEIRTAMKHGLVLQGSDEASVHAYFKDLLNGMHQSDKRVDITIANSVWAQGDVLPSFKSTCEKHFNAKSHPLSGAAPINSWVESETKGMIKTLLDADPEGPAVLLNAVYFKGEWQTKFDEAKTVEGTFRLFDGSTRPCMLMSSVDKKMLYTSTDYADVAVLPYGEGRFKGVVILPKKEGQVEMGNTIEALFGTPSSFAEVMDSIGTEHVSLQLPRFKVDYGPTSLKPALKKMGVESGFGGSGGFLRMTSDQSVYIQDVLHKAVIEVNEEGTTAAAATAVVMTRSLPAPPLPMVVDRPFLFAVHDTETNSLLFISRVESPELPK